MKYFILLSLTTLLFVQCRKPQESPKRSVSKITITKNQNPWKVDGVFASYHTDEDLLHVLSGKDRESFSISFKKGSIPTDGVLKDFSAGMLIAPSKGSAAISDSYSLDTTKDNRIKIRIIENLKNRVVGDFRLYLKRDPKFSRAGEINILEGRFDVVYEPFSLK